MTDITEQRELWRGRIQTENVGLKKMNGIDWRVALFARDVGDFVISDLLNLIIHLASACAWVEREAFLADIKQRRVRSVAGRGAARSDRCVDDDVAGNARAGAQVLRGSVQRPMRRRAACGRIPNRRPDVTG